MVGCWHLSLVPCRCAALCALHAQSGVSRMAFKDATTAVADVYSPDGSGSSAVVDPQLLGHKPFVRCAPGNACLHHATKM